jgi:hypothetical protein
MGAHSVFVHHHESAIEHVEVTAFDVEYRQALLDGDGS